MTPTLPREHDLMARYDYHEHPHGISVVLTNKFTHAIKAVGFAKYNPRDPEFNPAMGERIALGRALAKLKGRGPTHAIANLYPYTANAPLEDWLTRRSQERANAPLEDWLTGRSQER